MGNQFFKIGHIRRPRTVSKNLAQNWKGSGGFSDASLFAGSNFDARMLGWVGKVVFEDVTFVRTLQNPITLCSVVGNPRTV